VPIWAACPALLIRNQPQGCETSSLEQARVARGIFKLEWVWWRFDSVSRAMGSHSSRTPGAPHTIGEPGSVSGRPRQDAEPGARVGLARLSPVECTLRPSDSCVSIQPTEVHRFYGGAERCVLGGRRYRAGSAPTTNLVVR
jgi:hypothetical protein